MNTKAKPFVKWAGGKGQLIKTLEQHLPEGFDDRSNVTYVEPFVGGGAMLFHMIKNHPNIARVVINDINSDLIRCYQLIKDSPQILIDRLSDIEYIFYHQDINNKRELYYAYRDQYNLKKIDKDERAALFLFLNRTCYNGLYRVNSSGEFNVPFGRYKHPVICNEELIMADHELFSSIEVIIREPGDYKHIIKNLSRNHPNFIYFDPPYRPISVTSSFKEYSKNPFGDTQQEELKAFCDTLTERGCQLMVSNSDSKISDGTSYFERLYEGYQINRILAPRFINAIAEKREKQTEVLIKNY